MNKISFLLAPLYLVALPAFGQTTRMLQQVHCEGQALMVHQRRLGNVASLQAGLSEFLTQGSLVAFSF